MINSTINDSFDKSYLINRFEKIINNPTNVAWDVKCEYYINCIFIKIKKNISFEIYETKIESSELKVNENLEKIYNDIQCLLEDNNKLELKEENNQLIILKKSQNDEKNEIILSQIWNNDNGQILWNKYMSILKKKKN